MSIENNTTALRNLLDAVNALPSAGASSEDLTAEITAQKQLISDIQTSLEGKSAGGGGFETCTVTFDDGVFGEEIYWNSVVNGNIVPKYATHKDLRPLTLTNVVKNSCIVATTSISLTWTCEGAELMRLISIPCALAMFKITENATISGIMDD